MKMVGGDWNPDEFFVAQPGEKIVPTYVGGIVQAKVSDEEHRR